MMKEMDDEIDGWILHIGKRKNGKWKRERERETLQRDKNETE